MGTVPLAATALALAVTYASDIARIMAKRCDTCHSAEVRSGGYQTSSYAELLRGIAPGKPEASLLLDFLEGRRGEQRRMPLGKPALPADEIDRIRDWIAAGAPDSGSEQTGRTVWTAQVRKAAAWTVTCAFPSEGQATLTVRGADRVLFENAGWVDTAEQAWKVKSGSAWPPLLRFEVTWRFSGGSEPVRACSIR